MASTSVHFPDELLRSLNRLATESGKSRNRLIVEACQSYVEREREDWPEDFFSDARIDPSVLEELHRSLEVWLSEIGSSRQNRAKAPF